MNDRSENKSTTKKTQQVTCTPGQSITPWISPDNNPEEAVTPHTDKQKEIKRRHNFRY